MVATAGLKLLASVPNMLAREESQENQNGAESTNRENRRIASLTVWPLAALNFQLFWMVTTHKMMELKRNLSLVAYLSARKTYLQRKIRYLQARQVHGFPDSVVLFNLICTEFDVLKLYLSFETREAMNKILSIIGLIPLKSLLLPSGNHIVSCFSARAQILFRLHEIFSDFLALLAGLNPSPCNRQFDFKHGAIL